MPGFTIDMCLRTTPSQQRARRNVRMDRHANAHLLGHRNDGAQEIAGLGSESSIPARIRCEVGRYRESLGSTPSFGTLMNEVG